MNTGNLLEPLSVNQDGAPEEDNFREHLDSVELHILEGGSRDGIFREHI